MPLCVHCAYPAQHLYTTYKTKSNIRLGVCPRCDAFLDPLIEHPPLILLLDLILLKPRVFLHLLFNRGAPPLDATNPTPADTTDTKRDERIRLDVFQLLLLVIVAEAVVRVIPNLAQPGVGLLLIKTASVVLIETLAQHAVTLGLALLALRWRGWYPSAQKPRKGPKGGMSSRDGRQENFKPSLITLILLYTSLLPLLLQLFLSIWYTPPTTLPHEVLPVASTITLSTVLPKFVLESYPALLDIEGDLTRSWRSADRVWAGTRLLGGMSAGFGLRVLLPTRPWETTMIVLAGWVGASLAGRGIDALMAGV